MPISLPPSQGPIDPSSVSLPQGTGAPDGAVKTTATQTPAQVDKLVLSGELTAAEAALAKLQHMQVESATTDSPNPALPRDIDSSQEQIFNQKIDEAVKGQEMIIGALKQLLAELPQDDSAVGGASAPPKPHGAPLARGAQDRNSNIKNEGSTDDGSKVGGNTGSDGVTSGSTIGQQVDSYISGLKEWFGTRNNIAAMNIGFDEIERIQAYIMQIEALAAKQMQVAWKTALNEEGNAITDSANQRAAIDHAQMIANIVSASSSAASGLGAGIAGASSSTTFSKGVETFNAFGGKFLDSGSSVGQAWEKGKEEGYTIAGGLADKQKTILEGLTRSMSESRQAVLKYLDSNQDQINQLLEKLTSMTSKAFQVNWGRN